MPAAGQDVDALERVVWVGDDALVFLAPLEGVEIEDEVTGQIRVVGSGYGGWLEPRHNVGFRHGVRRHHPARRPHQQPVYGVGDQLTGEVNPKPLLGGLVAQ